MRHVGILLLPWRLIDTELGLVAIVYSDRLVVGYFFLTAANIATTWRSRQVTHANHIIFYRDGRSFYDRAQTYAECTLRYTCEYITAGAAEAREIVKIFFWRLEQLEINTHSHTY